MKRTVELTSDQLNTLVCYILMTTQHRKGEREAWQSLAREKNEDGTPKFANAQGNAVYYEELENKLDEIKEILDGAY